MMVYEDADATFLSLKYGVANAGDQNQDGYDDILVGGCQSNGCFQNNSITNIYLFLILRTNNKDFRY